MQGLVDALRRTDPEFLVTRASETPAGLNNGPGHYDAYYQNWHQHEQAFYRGIERADARGRERRLRKDRDWNEVEGAYVAQVLREPLRWLGLVDVGFDPGGEGPVAVRLTELGRRLFSRAPADAARRSRPVLVVQPNFEVVVLDALSNLDLLARLDAFAEAHGLDRAAIYRLTRQALVRGLAAGWTEEAIVATLEGEAGAPLPQNVRRSLRGWATDYERIRLRRGAALLEVGEPAELDALLADPATAGCVERRLAPTVALLRDSEPGTVAPLAARYGPRLAAIDYVVDRPRVLDVRSPGELVVAADADEPYLHYRLARFADRQDGAAAREGAPGDGGAGPVGAPGATYAITPASLARARASGYTIDDVLSFLGFKARTGLAADDVLTLRGWAGYYAPFRHARARVVEAPPTASWGDLSRVRALRPLIARVLSARLALIREEDWPRFEAALAARGIALRTTSSAPIRMRPPARAAHSARPARGRAPAPVAPGCAASRGAR